MKWISDGVMIMIDDGFVNNPGMVLPHPWNFWEVIPYREGSSLAKESYAQYLKSVCADKYWVDVEHCQYWSVCTCKLFHTRFYEKVYSDSGGRVKVLRDRSVEGYFF